MAVLRWILTRIILPISVLALITLAAGYYGLQYVRSFLDPVDPAAPSAIAVRIPQGATMADVAAILDRHRLIRHPLVFRYYARQEQLDSQVRPGEYLLRASMGVDEILQKLVSGDVISYRFTVPEGLTLEQLADVLAFQYLVDRERFLALAAESAAADAWVPADAPVRYRLEGYLFPDTYRYDGTITEAKIIEMMANRFAEVLSDRLMAGAAELGLSVNELVTLASIVEKEAAVADERARIAGVYWNRLRIGMKLDADPTVRYALDKPAAEPVLYKDLDVKSPYNTYRNPGLPPGPIASPGEAALRAVISPEAHEFLYFVARGDGSGFHVFSKTLSEHNRATRAEEQRAKAAAK